MTLSPISTLRPQISRYASQPTRIVTNDQTSQPQLRFGSEEPQKQSTGYRALQWAGALVLIAAGTLIHEQVANDGETFLGMPRNVSTLLKSDPLTEPASILHFQGFTQLRLQGELLNPKLMHNADGTKIYQFNLKDFKNTEFSLYLTANGVGLEAKEKGGETEAWAILNDEQPGYYQYESRNPNTGEVSRSEKSASPAHVEYFQKTFKELEERLQKTAIDHTPGKVSFNDAPQAAPKSTSENKESQNPEISNPGKAESPAKDAKPAQPKTRGPQFKMPYWFRFPEELPSRPRYV